MELGSPGAVVDFGIGDDLGGGKKDQLLFRGLAR